MPETNPSRSQHRDAPTPERQPGFSGSQITGRDASTVAAESFEAPDEALPSSHGKTQVWAVAHAPHSVFVYWDLAMPVHRLPGARLALAIERCGDGEPWPEAIHALPGSSGNAFFGVSQPGATYRLSIGFQSRELRASRSSPGRAPQFGLPLSTCLVRTPRVESPDHSSPDVPIPAPGLVVDSARGIPATIDSAGAEPGLTFASSSTAMWFSSSESFSMGTAPTSHAWQAGGPDRPAVGWHALAADMPGGFQPPSAPAP